jgi:hypothetical protein
MLLEIAAPKVPADPEVAALIMKAYARGDSSSYPVIEITVAHVDMSADAEFGLFTLLRLGTALAPLFVGPMRRHTHAAIFGMQWRPFSP